MLLARTQSGFQQSITSHKKAWCRTQRQATLLRDTLSESPRTHACRDARCAELCRPRFCVSGCFTLEDARLLITPGFAFESINAPVDATETKLGRRCIKLPPRLRPLWPSQLLPAWVTSTCPRATKTPGHHHRQISGNRQGAVRPARTHLIPGRMCGRAISLQVPT